MCQHRHVDIDQSPLGNTAQEAASWVRMQIERSLPPGWRVTGLDQSDTSRGQIVPIDAESGFGIPNYGVRIPAGLDLLIFTCGNSDHGPPSVEHAMECALVVEPQLLRVYGMRACLAHLFNNFRTNTYGLT